MDTEVEEVRALVEEKLVVEDAEEEELGMVP